VAALSDFFKAEQSAPHAPEAHAELGDLFFAQKNYGRAIQHYSDALDRDPNHAMALCKRGICHHYRRQRDSALDDLRSAARINPDIPNIERYIRMVASPTRR
jgi:tetratricopeptide (TPR) repeat protein